MAFSTIKELVTDLFKRNPKVSKEKVIDTVIEYFPNSVFDERHFRWYRYNLLNPNGRYYLGIGNARVEEKPPIDDFDGNLLLGEACREQNIDLGKLIAYTATWAHPKVYEGLKESGGCWYPNTRRGKHWEEKGKVDKKGFLIDDNIYANYAIKRAVGFPPKGVIKNFQACHIWTKTTYDARYHTNIANLVLLPKGIASLTDHVDGIRRILAYRAFKLYHWYPEDEKKPVRPKDYPAEWKEPNPFGDKVEKYLKNRRVK